jgi:hypothetical protein
MTLPEVERCSPPQLPSLGSLPPAPLWRTSEPSMGDWLAAKIEEEKRKQEEEKTKQETLRVKRREIELSMLRDSIQGGIPSQLVPTLFASISGGGVASASTERLREDKTQLGTAYETQPQAQARIQLSSEARNEKGAIDRAESPAYVGHLQAPQLSSSTTSARLEQPSSGKAQSTPLPITLAYADGAVLRKRRTVQPSDKRDTVTFDARRLSYPPLSRPTTHAPNISQSPAVLSDDQPVQQALLAQQQPTYASICFHQWTPPTTQPKKIPSVKQPVPASAISPTKHNT